MNTSISVHAWGGTALKANAHMGSHGACVLGLKVEDTEVTLYLPEAQIDVARSIADLLNSIYRTQVAVSTAEAA